MKIVKNEKGFALPVILVVIAIITTTGGYIAIKDHIQNQKQEKLIVEKNRQNNEKEEKQNQKQERKVKEETKNDNQIPSEKEKNEKEKNQTQDNEKKEKISIQENEENEENVKKEKTEEKKPDANKKTNYVDKPHPGGFIYIDSELQLSASKEENGIRLKWTRCNSDQFVAYKIARSDSLPDVYYPRDGSIASISNQDFLSYFDNNLEKGKTYYYRICSLEKNGESWCGNVVNVTF